WLVYWITERSGGELAFDTHRNGNVVTLTVPSARGEATSEPADPVNRLRIERGRRDGIAPE
ncbi:hypothetical protein SAMN04488066_12438, partial [Halorubrum aquaticum]